MSATSTTNFGDGSWGIGADQTGIIIQSQSEEYKNESKEVKNRVGNVTGKCYYNESVSITIDGLIPSTSPFSGKLASSLTLANGLSGYLQESVGVNGINIIEGITLDRANEDYKKIKITSTYHPYFAS